MWTPPAELEWLHCQLGAKNRWLIKKANWISLIYLNTSSVHACTLNAWYVCSVCSWPVWMFLYPGRLSCTPGHCFETKTRYFTTTTTTSYQSAHTISRTRQATYVSVGLWTGCSFNCLGAFSFLLFRLSISVFATHSYKECSVSLLTLDFIGEDAFLLAFTNKLEITLWYTLSTMCFEHPAFDRLLKVTWWLGCLYGFKTCCHLLLGSPAPLFREILLCNS